MKNIFAVLLLALTACATVHETCSNPETASRYKNYDQCYAEESNKREQRRAYWKEQDRQAHERTMQMNSSNAQNNNLYNNSYTGSRNEASVPSSNPTSQPDYSYNMSCGLKPLPRLGCSIGRCVNGQWEQVCN